jgi:hypothetical protein
MQRSIILAGLADQGVFDDSQVIEKIRHGEFACIVLQFPMESDPVPRYQSTDWVRREWIVAMREAGYSGDLVSPLYYYFPPAQER